MKQSDIIVGKEYMLDDGSTIFVNSHCGVTYVNYIDEFDKTVLVHCSRVIKSVNNLPKRLEQNLAIGDKITLITPYGEIHIVIPNDDYGYGEELIRVSTDMKFCIIPQMSNAIELKLLDGYEILKSEDVRDSREKRRKL